MRVINQLLTGGPHPVWYSIALWELPVAVRTSPMDYGNFYCTCIPDVVLRLIHHLSSLVNVIKYTKYV